MKTYSVKASEIKRTQHVIDAADQILGRVAVQAATLLMGKHKPMFSRHLDTGDFVVIINASKVRVTGNKLTQKFYYRHSGYPGGFRSTSLETLMEKDPGQVIQFAVKGMLPQNKMRDHALKKLQVFAGSSMVKTHSQAKIIEKEQKG